MPTTPQSHIRTADTMVIQNVFGLGNGYVL